jgi:hypothetical protein
MASKKSRHYAGLALRLCRDNAFGTCRISLQNPKVTASSKTGTVPFQLNLCAIIFRHLSVYCQQLSTHSVSSTKSLRFIGCFSLLRHASVLSPNSKKKFVSLMCLEISLRPSPYHKHSLFLLFASIRTMYISLSYFNTAFCIFPALFQKRLLRQVQHYILRRLFSLRSRIQ